MVDKEDPARNLNKKIDTTLVTKDGDTVLVTGITLKGTSSSENIGKNLYVFFNTSYLRKNIKRR